MIQITFHTYYPEAIKFDGPVEFLDLASPPSFSGVAQEVWKGNSILRPNLRSTSHFWQWEIVPREICIIDAIIIEIRSSLGRFSNIKENCLKFY